MLLIFFKTFEKFFKGPLNLHRVSQRPISEKRPISLSLIAVVLVTRQEYKGSSRKHTDWGKVLVGRVQASPCGGCRDGQERTASLWSCYEAGPGSALPAGIRGHTQCLPYFKAICHSPVTQCGCPFAVWCACHVIRTAFPPSLVSYEQVNLP